MIKVNMTLMAMRTARKEKQPGYLMALLNCCVNLELPTSGFFIKRNSKLSICLCQLGFLLFASV